MATDNWKDAARTKANAVFVSEMLKGRDPRDAQRAARKCFGIERAAAAARGERDALSAERIYMERSHEKSPAGTS